jgi:hypothetical protein
MLGVTASVAEYHDLWLKHLSGLQPLPQAHLRGPLVRMLNAVYQTAS